MADGIAPPLQVLLVGGADPERWRDVTDSVHMVSDAGLVQRDPTRWVLVVDGPATPRPGLVSRLTQAVAGGAVAAYSDFSGGARRRRVAPGGWSVERARWSDYTGPVALVRADLIDTTPGDIRTRALWAASAAGQIVYVPEPLYTARWTATPVPAGVRSELLAAAGAPYVLAPDGATRTMPEPPTISVVIPTRGTSGAVRGSRIRYIDHAIESIEATHGGDAAPLQYVLVVDSDAPHGFADEWTRRLPGRVTVVVTEPPFNFSAKVNAGVAAASGVVVAIVNDDIEVISSQALRTMAVVAMEPDVGAVGALLRYEDGGIQHAGQAFAADGVHHVGAGRPGSWLREHADLIGDRDVTGVTAACLVQRRHVWLSVGGLDESLPINFNDVEYCWRLRQNRLRIVQCGSVELFHFESRTRAAGAEAWEVELLRERMGADSMMRDPLTPEPAVRPARRVRARTAVGQVKGRVASRVRGREAGGSGAEGE